LLPYRFASIVDNNGIDDKILGVTKVSNITNTYNNIKQPKELVLKFTSISAVTSTNINIKTSNIGSRMTSLTKEKLYQYNLKFHINNR